VVSAANFNGPTQVVIAGHTAAVERAMQAARDAGARRSVRLPVSAPFHCSLMEPAARRLVPVLAEIGIRDPQVPVYTNVDACAVERAEPARDALVRQVSSPVRWEQLAGEMFDSGIDTFVEIGPGRVLTGLMRRIRKGARTFNVENDDDVDKVVSELEA
jgi:[acyl-carrier-protein] S-malonyltransferase